MGNLTRCPDCNVAPGEKHLHGCDVEPCPVCGGQRLSCGCVEEAAPLPWTGQWPGEAECLEFGWYAKLKPGRGWVPCVKVRGAHPDLSRLYSHAIWDRAKRRFVRADQPDGS